MLSRKILRLQIGRFTVECKSGVQRGSLQHTRVGMHEIVSLPCFHPSWQQPRTLNGMATEDLGHSASQIAARVF